MTIAAGLSYVRQQLHKISDSPSLDSAWLLLHVLGKKEASWLYAHGDQNLTQPQQILLEKLVQQRKTGKPLAYILGEWEFYGRPFYINKDVLVPRPSTEALIDTCLEYLQGTAILSLPDLIGQSNTSDKEASTVKPANDNKQKHFTIADIGTGSGCIIISLVLELNKLKVKNAKFKMIATDISDKALAVACRNAERHGVANQVEFLQCDMLPNHPSRDIDLIVSNPPYIPTAAKKGSGTIIIPDTFGLKFEPREALDGGPDGLKYIHQLLTLPYPMILETVGGQIIKKNIQG